MMHTVALAGLGSIGSEIVRAFERGIPGLELVAASNLDKEQAELQLRGLKPRPRLADLGELVSADIVVEALPSACFDSVAVPAIEAGKIFIPCSVGALLARPGLIERAQETGARIVVPTGAIAGLDAVRAIALGPISSAMLETRKPPEGLRGNRWLDEQGIDLAAIAGPAMLFEGNAGDAARLFPANANVAAALALAGIGPERTRVQIWADPTIERNVHKILIDAPSARLTIAVENVPSEVNPRTSRLAALSIIACLAGLAGTIKVGS